MSLLEVYLAKREALCFAVASGIFPKKENFLRNVKKKEREYFSLPNGKKHGQEKIWKRGALTNTRNFSEGKLDGLEVLFNTDGSKIGTIEWVNGVKHGLTVRFFPSGQIRRRWWKNGLCVYETLTESDGRISSKTQHGTTIVTDEEGVFQRLFDDSGIVWSFSRGRQPQVFKLHSRYKLF